MTATIHVGDALTVLRTLPEGLARCCVTSPPYWGLRDYGVEGQLGRDFVGIELNPAYAEMGRRRIRDDAPLLNTVRVKSSLTPENRQT